MTLGARRNDAIGSVTVTLRCKANIKKAVVQVRPKSSAVALENLDDPTHPAPGPAVVLTDISSGAPIKLRASYEGEKRPVRLSIVVHGAGFGKQVLNVETEPSFPLASAIVGRPTGSI